MGSNSYQKRWSGRLAEGNWVRKTAYNQQKHVSKAYLHCCWCQAKIPELLIKNRDLNKSSFILILSALILLTLDSNQRWKVWCPINSSPHPPLARSQFRDVTFKAEVPFRIVTGASASIFQFDSVHINYPLHRELRSGVLSHIGRIKVSAGLRFARGLLTRVSWSPLWILFLPVVCT